MAVVGTSRGHAISCHIGNRVYAPLAPQEPAPGGEATARAEPERVKVTFRNHYACWSRDCTAVEAHEAEYVHVNAYDTLAARVAELEMLLRVAVERLDDGSAWADKSEEFMKMRATLGESKSVRDKE